jgi:acetyl/propionyl-CoA carboxylase alpha subunit
MKHRTAIVAGKQVELSWTETETIVEATVGGRTYKIEKRRLGPELLWFGADGTSVEVAVTPTETGYDVSIRGNRITVEFVDARRKGRRQGIASDGVAAVRAPMPGKIVRILRQQGEEVEAHQGIVVMEAMKMQNEIRSPKRGKVAQLNVAEGDAVKLGELIAQVE